MKRAISISVCVLLVAAGLWFFCRHAINGSATGKSAFSASASAAQKTGMAGSAAPPAATAKKSMVDTNSFANRLAFRLANTQKTIGQLQRDPHAILLENAFIDTGVSLNLNLPSHLQSSGDPGAYIVQANGKIDNAFRAALVAAGAQIVSYIPNNAYLVRLNAGSAQTLTSSPLVQTVLPYEPYYKISSSAPVKIVQQTAAYLPTQKAETNTTTLLQLAVAHQSLPPGTFLTLGLFGDDAAATIAQIEKLGGKILSEDRSPFGKIVRVQPPVDWTALAGLSGVQLVEPAYRRKLANDLSRVAVGVSTDTITNVDYLGLTGKNVMVEVNDTGIDPTHPDFSATGTAQSGPSGATRVTGDFAGSLLDTDGHGTFVAGVIAGNGAASLGMGLSPSVNVGDVLAGLNFGSVSNADFRGKAPLADLFSVGVIQSDDGEGGNDTNAPAGDSYLQEQPALTNALISNNSWEENGGTTYDLSAASYDAATRDALPQVTGSQPVLFVFAAGNDGAGSDDGGASDAGISDSITSPGTAKNVITVGALEQPRNITNIVTVVSNGATNTYEQWSAATDTGSQVAGYSSRGNVGIETEGTYGRFKPDVVAPGTFVVSTRSSMWDTNTYYNNPTNYDDAPNYPKTFQTLSPNSSASYVALVPDTAVGIYIQIVPNIQSATPLPNLPLYLSLSQYGPGAGTNDIYSDSNSVSIPPATGGAITGIGVMQGNVFFIGVSNNTSQAANYDLDIVFATTNNVGDYDQVLEGLNNQIGPYYRYESGTSIAAPSVSGVLADMQDFFTNTLHTTPSPALLKAMLINGARVTAGGYNYQVNNAINFEGWGLVNLPNSIPATLEPTNTAPMVTNMFFVDQSPTNALATGDSQTYGVVLTSAAEAQSFRVTLAWTDPPGNPAAAIKLVNNLELVVTNLDDPTNPIIFYGNDIAGGSLFNTRESTNTPAASVVDTINNVQNVYIQAGTGTNFTVTVIGAAVNVNAVNAQTNDWTAGTYAPNIVQDFALVIASGDGPNTNGFTITGVTNVINPLNGQDITIISTNNSPLLNQFAGASSPLLGTNDTTFAAGSAGALYGSQAVLTIGQTNQWHFYIVTNNGLDASTGQVGGNDVTNAAFVTYSPDTAAIPREGVYAETDANSTRPEADIDVFVTTDSNLLTLSPLTISNCMNSGQTGASVGSAFQGSSLGRGGSEFVVDTNSQLGEVYYVGVQSEDQTAAEYDFLSAFSSIPFSSMANGDETVNFFPVTIPGGNSTHPGVTNTIGLAIYPINIQRVVVTNYFNQQNAGDITESLSYSSPAAGSSPVVLYNHASPNQSGIFTNIYDDSGQGDIVGAQNSAGPGTLKTYLAQQGIGVWLLTGSSDAPGFSTTISATMFIQHQQDLKQPNIATFVVPGQTWAYDYVEVPVGSVNLTVLATNVSVSLLNTPIAMQPLQLYLNFGSQPTFSPSNYLAEADLTNSSDGLPFPSGINPWNEISTGPPLPPGIYYVGIYNPNTEEQEVQVSAVFPFNANAIETNNYVSAGPIPILDDAVTTNSIFVTNTDVIQDISIGLRVDHPRISDLAFTLIDPEGDRYLLMENRGGTTTNGCGATIITTNNFAPVTSAGSYEPQTNQINVGEVSGTLSLDYNFYSLSDQMTVYASTNPADFSIANAIFNTGMTNGTGQTNISFTSPSGYLTIIMNQFGNPNDLPGDSDAWTYTLGGLQTNYVYLTFTEDTNLTITPIKFAPVPLVPQISTTTVFTDNFDTDPAGTNTTTFGGWTVLTNQVAIVTNPPASSLPNSLALNDGAVLTLLPTVAGQQYILSYMQGSSAPDDTGAAATNADWVSQDLSFTATATGTPLILNASGSPINYPGAEIINFSSNTLVDTFILTTQTGGLYYQPEQPLSPLIGNGISAYGNWQLEILDSRAGASNNAVLDSWQMQFTFANTNFSQTGSLTNGMGQTNFVEANSIYWFTINVPINADIATNSLFFSSLPLNLLFSTNAPPTTNDALSDAVLLSSVTNGSVVFGTNGWAGGLGNTNPPAFLVPGGTYYLGFQNTNNTAAQFGAVVSFHFTTGGPLAFTQPATGITGTNAQLNGMATPNGLPSYAWFEYGTTTDYGNFTPLSNIGAGSNVVYLTENINNLETNVPYHFRQVTFNAAGITYGFDQVFDEANVAAWGADYVGQINVPAGLSNVVAIAGAYDHSLAINNNKMPFAWGDNSFGQSIVPSGLSNVVAVAGGQYYSMVLQTNGIVTTWGLNDFFGVTNVPAGLSNVVTIAGGTFAALALQTNGAVVSWGANFSGQTNVPAGLSNCVAIAGGSYHSLAVRNDGTVVAWGDDSSGQTNIPAGLNNVVAIACGNYHSLALRGDGTVVSWGDDSAGQTNVPVGLSNVVAVAAGGFNSQALLNNGTLVSWGDNSANQSIPPLGLTNIIAISDGYLHSLALTPLSVFGTNSSVGNLTGGTATNSIFPHAITYYLVTVPTNADFATNQLYFAQNGPLNIWFSTNNPPTINATNDVLLIAGLTNGTSILTTNGSPLLVPGGTYYLGVNNTNSFTVTYGIGVNFHLIGTATNTPAPTNAIFLSSIVYTNISGTNGFLLTWFAPSNDLFQVEFTDALGSTNWTTFTNIISYNPGVPATATNAQFNFFDNGSEYPFGTSRFYRLITLGILGSSSALTLPVQSNLVVIAGTTLTLTNAATDSRTSVTLTYTLTNSPSAVTNPVISTNGIITWTPPASSTNTTYTLTTIVTDNGSPQLSATNSFIVLVAAAVPSIGSVSVNANGVNLQWTAPTNEEFEVQSATNITPPIVWFPFTNIITSTSGTFSFMDTNTASVMKFYELILLP